MIADLAIPKILVAFQAVLEKAILGRRTKVHPPVWLAQCANAVANHLRYKSPENTLLGKEFAQPISTSVSHWILLCSRQEAPILNRGFAR